MIMENKLAKINDFFSIYDKNNNVIKEKDQINIIYNLIVTGQYNGELPKKGSKKVVWFYVAMYYEKIKSKYLMVKYYVLSSGKKYAEMRLYIFNKKNKIIKEIVDSSNGSFEYIKELSEKDLDNKQLAFYKSKRTGYEFHISFHLFKIDKKMSYIHQIRILPK